MVDIPPLPATCPSEVLPTGKEVYFQHLYGSMGYYSRGGISVAYDSPVDAYGPYYAEAYLNYIRTQIYEPMRKSGSLREDEEFIIEEHGPGNGNLSRGMIEHARQMAEKDEDWANFYKQLHFRAIDIAEPSYNELKKLEEKYPGKFMAMLGDVIERSEVVPFKGVVTSVYLVDSFPAHYIKKTDPGFGVVLETPRYDFKSEKAKKNFVEKFYGREDSTKVLSMSEKLRNDCFGGIDTKSKHPLYLSLDEWVQLLKKASLDKRQPNGSMKEIIGDFVFVSGTVDSESFPEVARYLDKVKDLPAYSGIPLGGMLYINTDMVPYAENIRKNLIEGAFTTIDTVSENGQRSWPISQRRSRRHLFGEGIAPEQFGMEVLYLPLEPNIVKKVFEFDPSDKPAALPHVNLYDFSEDKGALGRLRLDGPWTSSTYLFIAPANNRSQSK